jgi:selenide,water dikinase
LLSSLADVTYASGWEAPIPIGAGAEFAYGIPLVLGNVRDLAAQGMVTGASGRNWAGYGAEVGLPVGFADVDRALLTDPQTSGGLLVSCDPAALDDVLAVFRRHGFAQAAPIGRVVSAPADAPRLQLN